MFFYYPFINTFTFDFSWYFPWWFFPSSDLWCFRSLVLVSTCFFILLALIISFSRLVICLFSSSILRIRFHSYGIPFCTTSKQYPSRFLVLWIIQILSGSNSLRLTLSFHYSKRYPWNAASFIAINSDLCLLWRNVFLFRNISAHNSQQSSY